MFRPLLPLLSGVMLLAGCASNPPLVATPTLTVTKDASLPPPGPRDFASTGNSSYIGPLDTLVIEVFNVPELTKIIVVDGDGKVSIPLVGTLDVNGKTTGEIAQQIDRGLRGKYVRNPFVTVTVRDSVSQLVTVDGSVSKPGLYPVTNRTTLMRAVALSGGLSEYAKIDDVVILRTVDNKKMAGLYNLGAIRRGVYDDPPIYPNDVVVVGDSPTRRLFRNVLQAAPLAVSALVAILTTRN